jgi:DNA-binding beta-propeller fold protein YncE
MWTITLAGSFNRPSGIAVDMDENVYVADTFHNTIKKISPDGTVTIIAGIENQEGSDDGLNSLFNCPTSLTLENDGTLFVSDTWNNIIRKISTNGYVSTFAGVARHEGSKDGFKNEALFATPRGVVFDLDKNLLVADTLNHTIRKIDTEGKVTTFAGMSENSGYNDGYRTQSRFHDPRGLAIDQIRNVLLITDTGNHTVRIMFADGQVETIAGKALNYGSQDGNGKEATFKYPYGTFYFTIVIIIT